MKKSLLIPLIPVAAVLALVMSHSCANTTTPPTGGPKDTIPPLIVKIDPLPGSVNVPVHDAKVVFTFNEYVTVKDPKSIVLSPPQKKAPKYKMKGKSLVVYFEEDLKDNTCYTIDLTNAIADNNEGNMFPGYVTTFSTGSKIDSMMVTGLVQDYKTLNPMKGATVLIFKDQSDSAIFKGSPDAAVKTDDWGFFCIRNIKDTVYRLYALRDENNDNKYDPESEAVAFMSSTIRPVTKMNDSIPELLKYDMKDTLLCRARKTEYELTAFRGKPSKQMIVNKVRLADRSAYITFMAPGADVDSLWIDNINPKRIITQFDPLRDSLELWVNDQRKMPDTLHLNVRYMKTDSTQAMIRTVEKVPLVAEKKSGAAKSSKKNLKHEDTTCVIKTVAQPETVEQNGITMEVQYPLVVAFFDSLQFKFTNPRQQEFKAKFTVTRDRYNLRLYTIRPDVTFKPGFDYLLKIPERVFMDVNGHYNDSSEVKFSLPKDEDLSLLKLVVKGTDGTDYIVDLLDEGRQKTLRSYRIDSDRTLIFPYLKAGLYSIRITEDPNNNGLIDTGDLLSHRQPEKVLFYKIKDKSLIDVLEKTELEQTVNLHELFDK